jgi:CubicO group peptidase (beta-lactamase class C family)
MSQATIGGWCDPRFGAVQAEFDRNFRERGELGSAICVTLDGVVVTDLWGGWTDADQRRPWSADTLVNVFSVGKGLLAVCAARLAGLGQLDPDALVARYWPEFGAAGKDGITVRQVLSHQAGLPALRQPLPRGSGLDWQLMTSLLAAEQPWWPPGSGHGYHVNTFGYLAGELIRRITGTSVGQFLRREVAGPLGADVHIGLPAAEHGRVAEFRWPQPEPEIGEFLRREVAGPLGADVHIGLPAAEHGRVAEFRWPNREPETAADQAEPVPSHQMSLNAYFNPPDFSGVGVVNTAAWRSAQIPSANAHATAAGIARVYTALAAGGTLAGVGVVTSSALAAATREQVYG